MSEDKNPEYVEALARGLAVIEAFDETTPEMTLTELARKVDMSPATVRRNLHTLEALGFVRRNHKHFLLAPRILTLGSAYLKAVRVDEAIMPELHRITELFGDAANVGVLDGTNVLYIAHVSETRAARRMASIGVTYPAYATSMGRVLLAHLPPEDLDAYFQKTELRKLTDVTVTSEKEMRKILADVRVNGYSVTVDQLDYGITALAVPIRDNVGKVVAAVNTSGYSPRLKPQDLLEQRLAELQVAAARVSNLLLRYPALLHSLGMH
ncbi:MAG: IclR family transcriptional regulator [Mesorhizobium sp. 61-13]|nr:MAG: IclR family transcriptional regulator [Mesorhizobium sp. 61-13]